MLPEATQPHKSQTGHWPTTRHKKIFKNKIKIKIWLQQYRHRVLAMFTSHVTSHSGTTAVVVT